MGYKLRNYWIDPPSHTVFSLEECKQQLLEEHARENKLIIHVGKAIKPSSYPCGCWKQRAGGRRECWEAHASYTEILYDKQRDEQNICKCPCHTHYEAYYEPKEEGKDHA